MKTTSIQPWRHRSFLKDSKLRVRERYWRTITTTSCRPRNSNNETSNSKVCLVLPDALTWRKYLRLLQKLVKEPLQVENTDTTLFRWILLESAAELLDYRSQAPTICVAVDNTDDNTVGGDDCDKNEMRREAAASQERSTLMRLVQQHDTPVDSFCDLSVRDAEADEWEWLDYDNLSVEERCRHALVRAGRMLSEQQQNEGSSIIVEVVLVVSNEDHLTELKHIQLDKGMRVLQVDALIEMLATARGLSRDQVEPLVELRKVSEEEYETKNQKHSKQFTDKDDEAEELSLEQIQAGLRNKTLLRGRFEVTKDNPKEAFVSVSSSSTEEEGIKSHKTYFIEKRHFRNAFHQDTVILRALPKEQWGRPVGRHRLVNHRDDDDDDNDDGFMGDLSIPSVPSARIVAISKPSRRTFVATMVNPPKDADSHILVIPRDMRIPKIRIHARSWQNYVNMRLKIQVDGWEAGSTYPHGRCIDVMGPIGDLETEIAALLHENQIDLDPFSTAALSCLPTEGPGWTIPPKEIENRRDLRTCRQIFSVDPPGCQDIDDTMHAFQLPNGDIEIGVHIADVTYFVAHNSALDLEAQARGTTFYLVDRRFDMLPSLLSSDLCSLHGGTDRLTVSVIWTLSSDLNDVKSCWYGRTLIHNCAAMTYDQADNILEGKSPDDPNATPPPPLTAGSPVDPSLIKNLKEALTTLTCLARKLRGAREAIGGAVDLTSGDIGKELKFTLEGGRPTKVAPKKDKEIHHTIAELMILANTYVATKIYKAFPDSALLRIHRSVEEDRFNDLREILEAGGISFDGVSNFDLANTLKNAKRKTIANSTVNALFRSLATRAMSEALYVCTGDGGNGIDFSHYGLGLENYTHFTSPIRRYADVVVHKQLLLAFQNEQQAVTQRPSSGIRSEEPQISLPDSNVVSILGGEGLADNCDDILDSLIQDASELALGPDPIETSLLSEPSPLPELDAVRKAYGTMEVSRICDGLNQHTRLAKHSSTECQQLFLSLYFRDHVEVTSAVVVNLRDNGFFAFVPKFDLKVPVYLRDVSEQVQIDPVLLGLSRDAGLQSTAGFAGSNCRRFPLGKCSLLGAPDERLEVSVPEAPKRFIVRPLDVVTIQLTCDSWDIRARVPSPRAQLLTSGGSSAISSGSSNVAADQLRGITSRQLKGRDDSEASGCQLPNSPVSSISEALAFAVRVRPVIQDVSMLVRVEKQVPSDRDVTLGGRLVFGGFVNPDTRAAVQEASQQNASAEAAQRRQNVMQQAARRDEYDATMRIERSTMARQQRLAADKRNARRSKAK